MVNVTYCCFPLVAERCVWWGSFRGGERPSFRNLKERHRMSTQQTSIDFTVTTVPPELMTCRIDLFPKQPKYLSSFMCDIKTIHYSYILLLLLRQMTFVHPPVVIRKWLKESPVNTELLIDRSIITMLKLRHPATGFTVLE